VPALFVDTGAFYAFADTDDAHHAAAFSTFMARGSSGDLVTTDHVIVETWLLMRGRLGAGAAMRFWDGLESGVIKVLGVTSAEFARAKEIARNWTDQQFSLVDCTSFAVMERRKINAAFAFDRHFRVFRAGADRKRCFHVVP
jgi:predicted nucleic acid-binding protein